MMESRVIKIILSTLLVVVILGLPEMSQAQSTVGILRSGDRVVFLGDSITEQRIYTRYVIDYISLRYPDLNITFRNAGWGGDTAQGGLNRLQRDVLSLKPTVVTICFGMNDAGYGPFKQELYDRYIEGMKGLVSELKKAEVRVVLLTPGCVDPDRNQGLKDYNATLARFARGVMELAEKEKIPAFDIHTLMLDAQTKAKEANPEFTMIPDSVHPSDPGHILMAYGLLQALGCSVQPSSLGLLNVNDRITPAVGRCALSDLNISENEISFTRKDFMLPWHLDNDCRPVLDCVPAVAELNKYMFRITGLKPGNWKLTVQGMEIGRFSSEELAGGVDLSGYPGPWKKLAEEVNSMVWNQEQMYFIRWRELSEASYLADEAKAAMRPVTAQLDKVIAEWEAKRIKKAASPENRTWEWKLVREQ